MDNVCEKIHSQLHKDEFITISYSEINYQKINWINEREFVMENQWYDLVDKKLLDNGSYLLVVFPDLGETKWFDFIFKSKQDPTSSDRNHLTQKVFDLFMDPIDDMESLLLSKNDICTAIHWNSINCNLKFFPPPRQV